MNGHFADRSDRGQAARAFATRVRRLLDVGALDIGIGQLPDAFVFLDVMPRTSVGKFKKSALREQFADWKWES